MFLRTRLKKERNKLGVRKSAAELCLFIVILLVGLGSGAKNARSQSSGGAPAGVLILFPERQQERRSSRWTLADWLITKKEIARQNMWLYAHTNHLPIDVTYSTDIRAGGYWGHELDVYLLGFGLRARYEQPFESIGSILPAPSGDPNVDAKSGEVDLQLRLFGGNVQNTNLILRLSYEYDHIYGLSDVEGPYAGFGIGPELQIYFAHWLGLRGDWRYRWSRENIADRSQSLAGNSWSTVAFLEMGALRLEGGWQSRSWQITQGQTTLRNFTLSGLVGRFRFFF